MMVVIMAVTHLEPIGPVPNPMPSYTKENKQSYSFKFQLNVPI